jgi:hypothetical protein
MSKTLVNVFQLLTCPLFKTLGNAFQLLTCEFLKR